MSAIFSFSSLLETLLLLICTSAYVHRHAPALLDRDKGFFWKLARIGERLSPFVAIACFLMAFSILLF